MPHIIVKMYPDRTPAEKADMARRLALDLQDNMGYAFDNVSVSVVEIEPDQWMQAVYEPDIANAVDVLVKRPGYGPLAEEKDAGSGEPGVGDAGAQT